MVCDMTSHSCLHHMTASLIDYFPGNWFPTNTPSCMCSCLTHWDFRVYTCVGKSFKCWLYACLVQSHALHRRRIIIVKWSNRNNFQWDSNDNINIVFPSSPGIFRSQKETKESGACIGHLLAWVKYNLRGINNNIHYIKCSRWILGMSK